MKPYLKSANSFVYLHIREDKNEVFYVGIGSTSDFKRAYDKYSRRNAIWSRIVNKTKYKIIIYKSGITWDKACSLEKYLIKKIGRRNLKTGPLCNLTDGGEGGLGRVYVASNETKLKISAKLKGMFAGNKHHFYGKTHSNETKQKIGASSIGRLLGNKNPFYNKKHTPDSIIKMKESKMKKVINTETNEIYYSIQSASKNTGIKYSTLAKMLSGFSHNTTKLELVQSKLKS